MGENGRGGFPYGAEHVLYSNPMMPDEGTSLACRADEGYLWAKAHKTILDFWIA